MESVLARAETIANILHVDAINSLLRARTDTKRGDNEASLFEHLVVPWVASSRAPHNKSTGSNGTVQKLNLFSRAGALRIEPVERVHQDGTGKLARRKVAEHAEIKLVC